MNHGCLFRVFDNEVKLCFPTEHGWVVHGFTADAAREFARNVMTCADALEAGVETGTGTVLLVNAADLETPTEDLRVEDPAMSRADPDSLNRHRSMFCPKGYAYIVHVPGTGDLKKTPEPSPGVEP